MSKRPTIKTIAEIAGVSHVAVSKALRDHTDISKETTARIKKIAEDVGYMPNIAARNLSSHRSTTIGMIVPTMENNTSYNPIFNTISSVAAESGYCVMLGSSHHNLKLEEQHCRMMIENRIGALIIAPCSNDNTHINTICKNQIPIIYIGGNATPDQKYQIYCNYQFSAELAVEHLHQLGHRNIAFFSYGPENITLLQKEEGFVAAMTKRSLTPLMYRYGDASDTLDAGYELTRRLIANHALPTAIWCANDLMAAGVHNCLIEHSYHIPQDISLMGHDNLFFCCLPELQLTTISLPTEPLARTAVNLAIGLIDEIDGLISKQTFQTQLIVRSTTGPAPFIPPSTTNQ